MGKIKNKVFGLVVSKNVTDALADSIKDNNQAKFYLAQDKTLNGQALDDVTTPNELTDRNVLIINGNKIQGVNQNDLSKLDAITDVSKLFKYKGSVATKDELLKKVPPETEVGDVWNVEQECEIDGVKYPAHTNFVCSSTKASIVGKPASSTWDSLGGTMQMGTAAEAHKDNEHTLVYYTYDPTIPITQFSLMLSNNGGLYVNSQNRLDLNHNNADEQRIIAVNNRSQQLIYKRRPNSIIDNISIRVGTPLCISANNEIELKVGTGLAVDDGYTGSVYLNLKSDPKVTDLKHKYEGSGLSYDSNQALSISLATSAAYYNDIIPNGLGLVTYAGTAAGHATGGLYISESAIVDFIKNNTAIEIYISSLINEKLKAY